MDVEQHNQRQIERLNQRGGRMLSIVDRILFMRVVSAPRGYRRRVASFWEADGQGGHRMVFRWNANTDAYEPTAELHDPAGLGRCTRFLQGLLDEGEIEIGAVRRKAVEFYRDGK